jgi:Mrp family chromosome partitioning ATPase
MEWRHIILIVRRWGWLAILAAIIAGAATFVVSAAQAPVYESSARLIVGPGIDSVSPDLNALRAGGQLMQTYAELPETRPFLEAVAAEANLEIDSADLAEMIEVRANEETQILTIIVQAHDATTAETVANAVAKNLVRISPSGAGTTALELSRQMRRQAEQLETAITLSEERISQLETTLQGATDPGQQADLADLLSDERDRLAANHDALASLYALLQGATTNQVKIIEPAGPAEPVLSLLWLKVLVGMLSGFVLVGGLIVAYEALTDSLDAPEDLLQVMDVAVLGSIPQHKPASSAGRRLVVEAAPDSAAAESYRMLAIKLLFSNHAQGTGRSILLSSLTPTVDVGELAANLAVVLSQTGSRIVLIDANPQRPTIGQHFGIVNRCGLTDILTGECKTLDLTAIDWAPGLLVLPSGPVTYNSFVLLASPHMLELLTRLEEQADIVLIAGSPLARFADSLFLASRVDGVMVVAHSGQARRRALREAITTLRDVGASIVGTVLYGARRARKTSFAGSKALRQPAFGRRLPAEPSVLRPIAGEQSDGRAASQAPVGTRIRPPGQR